METPWWKEISEWHSRRVWDAAERHRPGCLLVWVRGGKESIPFILPPTAQCGVKSTHGRARETKGGRAGAAGKFRQQRLKILGKQYSKAEKTLKNPTKKLLAPAKPCCFKHIESKALFKGKLFYASIKNGHSFIL